MIKELIVFLCALATYNTIDAKPWHFPPGHGDSYLGGWGGFSGSSSQEDDCEPGGNHGDNSGDFPHGNSHNHPGYGGDYFGYHDGGYSGSSSSSHETVYHGHSNGASEEKDCDHDRHHVDNSSSAGGSRPESQKNVSHAQDGNTGAGELQAVVVGNNGTELTAGGTSNQGDNVPESSNGQGGNGEGDNGELVGGNSDVSNSGQGGSNGPLSFDPRSQFPGLRRKQEWIVKY